MIGRRIGVLCVCFTLGFTLNAAQARLVGHWDFNEGSGGAAADASGNHYDGVLSGDLEWVEGMYGGGLSFSNGASVDLSTHAEGLSTMSDYTVAFWVTGYNSESGQVAMSWSNGTNSYRIQLELHEGEIAHGQRNGGGWEGTYSDVLDWNPTEWYHMVFQKSGDFRVGWRNGIELLRDDSPVGVGPADLKVVPNDVRIGALHSAQFFIGDLDEVRLYDEVLTEQEIQDVMLGRFELATAPQPDHEATDVPRDVVLSWVAGNLAGAHDVYLGTVLEDVEMASRAEPKGVLVSQGQTASMYQPAEVLTFGQTYYWRVDEVNATPDNTIFRGDLWSFTVEPFAYPIENIVVTTNAVPEGDAGPEVTIDGSGLNANDEHSTMPKDMWVGTPVGNEPVYVEYEFDSACKLYELHVWNFNMAFESLFGFGFKDVTVEYSEDGVEWMLLGDVQFAQATGRSDYTANTIVDMQGVCAKHVRLTANSAYGTMGQFGLSEVRFLYLPVQARQPQPADGAENVAIEPVFAWRPGREVGSHQVYLGTDPEALVLVDTVDTCSYRPDALDLGTSYYWRIDETNETEVTAVWPGQIWGFSTQDFLVIDDFEGYTDDIEAGTTIWQTWIDGVEDPANGGSLVGHATSPFAEQTVVHSGRQSMPLFYDNTTQAVSETVRVLEGQDWTASGATCLSLYFQGLAGNTGQLYVLINGTRVDYDSGATDIAAPFWQVWNIDLTSIVDAQSVTTLTIGIEGAGAKGVVYVDDIRLYPAVPEPVVPAAPDTSGLLAHYTFDGNATDISGHGFDGAEDGGVTYGVGVDGQAIKLDGFDDYVVVGAVGVSGTAPRTIAGWVKADTLAISDYTSIFGFTSTTALTHASFDMNKVLDQYRMHVYNWEGDIMAVDLEWHHLAATYDGATIARYGDGRLIGLEERVIDTQDHVQIGKRAHDAGGCFPGAIDEFYIYDRALPEAEIAWLAGRRAPVHKPF